MRKIEKFLARQERFCGKDEDEILQVVVTHAGCAA